MAKRNGSRTKLLPYEIWTNKVKNTSSTPADRKKFFAKLIQEFNGDSKKVKELVGVDIYNSMTKKVKPKKHFGKSKITTGRGKNNAR